MSHFAVARHRSEGQPDRRFAVLRGAAHSSFASSSQAVAGDLLPTLSDNEVHAAVADLVDGFLGGASSDALEDAEAYAAAIAAPLVAALKLEGSSALGVAACNSDYPTNPTCGYTKWPDHSLPFGPAPAPNPLPPADCVCGSPWVAETAAAMLYQLPPPVTAVAKDAFHDVADTHPFHLPHIFNKCAKPDSSCQLNTTTLSMPFMKAGSLWSELPATAQPLSALELRSKIKSMQAIYEAAALPGASPSLDKNHSLCANVNKAALKWAMDNAEKGFLDKYVKEGEPMVIVDDKDATIGITGPEWIKDELKFSRVKDATSPTGTRIEVQSWTFVVGNTNNGNVPWFFPVGMHYCKLLSPARAMEWIYTDAYRVGAADGVRAASSLVVV